MVAKYVVVALVAVCFLMAVPAQAQSSRTGIRSAAEDNSRWRSAAIARESMLVQEGDRHLKSREYGQARDCYQRALDITYIQWDTSTKQFPTPKVTLRLETANTAKARNALQNMDATVRADAMQEWKKQAAALLKQADLAMAQKNAARAYSIYMLIISAAQKESDVKDAASVDTATRKLQELLKAANGALDEAEKALAAGKATDAVTKLNDFLTNFDDLQAVVADIKERAERLSNDPVVTREIKEQAVRKEMALGDAALARTDYVSTLRRYRMAASMYPETDASHQAADKVMQMQNDPKIMEALKKQESESRGRQLFLQAETLRNQNDAAEAAVLYQEILDDCPDSTYAPRAKSALEDLGPQPAPTGAPDKPAPVEPKTEDAAAN